MRFSFFLILALYILISPCETAAQINGCTDRAATNYSPSASVNDGSCIYDPGAVSPVSSTILPDIIPESSGLIHWDNRIWTHNDSDDITLYALDTVNAIPFQSYPLSGLVNNDWEEISQDNEYIYIGDIGNNQNGNRRDLTIIRVEKNSLHGNSPVIDSICFSYSDQTDFEATGFSNTDFDCEAFIVSDDSIYLFTKQWISSRTGIYSLPKSPGTHIAKLRSVYDSEGLITGAAYLKSKNLLVLLGYSREMQPFIILFYDFKNTDFLSGNKRKLTVSLPFHQTEGISTKDGLKYYISNEKYSEPPFIEIPQKLHIFDLGSFLGSYMQSLVQSVNENTKVNNFRVYPVPAGNLLFIKSDPAILQSGFMIISNMGRVVLNGVLTSEIQNVDISDFSTGIYFFTVRKDDQGSVKIVKK